MRSVAECFDSRELDRVKWRAKAGIAGLLIGAAFVIFVALPPARLLLIFEEQISQSQMSNALQATGSYSLTGLLILIAASLMFYGLRRFRSRARENAIRATRAVTVQVSPLRVHRAGMRQGGRQLRRPSFLPEQHTDDAKLDLEAETPRVTGPSAQSAAGFLMRFRRSLALGETGAEASIHTTRERRIVRHPRFRHGRFASTDSPGSFKVRTPDTILNQIYAAGRGGVPRAVLVGSANASLDATAEAVSIARALAAGGDQIVLADLACGRASISGTLGLPSSPGFADLVTGRAGFEDVVRVDAETPLQVITAGGPPPPVTGENNERFTSVLEALTQAYDGVVLHADHEALRKFTPALKFELSAAIAVVNTATGTEGAKGDLSAFSPLGCPVFSYEKPSAERHLVSPAAASSE